MGTTTNYGYNVPVGSDNVNLLPQMAANFPMIDSDLKAVSNTGVGTATELVTGTVHALTRADRDRNVFKFVATSDFEAGETFEVDGVQVTAKTPDGRNLSTGAYVINSSVLCMLDGTLLTVIVNPAKALDSENLDGHPATYFATAAALSALDNQLGAVSSKVGTGVLDVGNDCVDGINTINTHLLRLTSNTANLKIKTISKSVANGTNIDFSTDGFANVLFVDLVVDSNAYRWNITQKRQSNGTYTFGIGYWDGNTWQDAGAQNCTLLVVGIATV